MACGVGAAVSYATDNIGWLTDTRNSGTGLDVFHLLLLEFLVVPRGGCCALYGPDRGKTCFQLWESKGG